MTDYRSYIQNSEWYGITGVENLAMLVRFGLREQHRLLDLGCGSLRVGRFLLSYLDRGNYYGIEPNIWLVKDAIEGEGLGSLVYARQPAFTNTADFNLACFGVKFDFILATSILTHASQGQVRACLHSAALALEESGIFLASINLHPTDQYQGPGWAWPETINHTAEFVEAAAQEAGLVMMSLDWSDTMGQDWIAFLRSYDAYREAMKRLGKNIELKDKHEPTR